jgi:cyclic pyranopterin phosphate synthase
LGFVDSFGRIHDDLRVSVTDRCNLRCLYCMPERPVWFPRSEILSYEEIARIVEVLARHGVRRVRITGGEPLVRQDLPVLFDLLSRVPGLEDLSLTTNGLRLRPLAKALARAGLRRVNVSLDTLDPARFRTLTGRDGVGLVLEGLEAAREAGLSPIKINTVLLRGLNEDEVVPLAAFARERGFEIRFIEFMPLENGGRWEFGRVVPGSWARREIESRWPLEPDPRSDPRAPARRFLYRDGRGAVGFVNSVSEPFCADCGRLRLTADGKLRVCLYDDRETDLKSALRSGASDSRLALLVEEAVGRKGRGGALEILERRAARPLARTMHQIGG